YRGNSAGGEGHAESRWPSPAPPSTGYDVAGGPHERAAVAHRDGPPADAGVPPELPEALRTQAPPVRGRLLPAPPGAVPQRGDSGGGGVGRAGGGRAGPPRRGA